MTAPADASLADRATGWRHSQAVAARVSLGRSGLWPFGLVAFLLKGGLVLYLLPIVVVPSTVGVATWIGPTALGAAGPSTRLVGVIAGAGMAAVLWFVIGGLVAAAADVELIRRSLGAEGVGDRGALIGRGRPPVATAPIDLRLCARLLLVRLVAALPLVVVLAWGVGRIVSAGYGELTMPRDTATPLPVRVLLDVPEVIVAVLVAWIVAETMAGIAGRRIVLFGDRGLGVAAGAVRQVVRHPMATLGTIGVTLAGGFLLVVPGLVSSAIAWDRLAEVLVADFGIASTLALTVLFVAVWASGLALAGAAATWRSLAWTLELLRTEG